MKKRLMDVVQEIVLEGDMPAKELAGRIGKAYPTLLREINPYDTGAKLGVETLMDIIRETHDIMPLRFMAESLGYEVMPSCALHIDGPAMARHGYSGLTESRAP